MRDNYIELERKFRKIDELKFNEHEDLANIEGDISWDQILEYKCSVLIAEAGSGKTKEMKQMVAKLEQQQKYAFFCDISVLATSGFEVEISSKQQKFEKWKQGKEVGYFFLDSVDEAKLVDHKNFMTAFKKFVSALGLHLARVTIVISSRPTAWKLIEDGNLVKEEFQSILLSSEKLPNTDYGYSQIKNQKSKTLQQIFQMMPLTYDQIKNYI